MNKKTPLTFNGTQVSQIEWRIMNLISVGRRFGTDEIAAELRLTKESVWSHMSHLERKFTGQISRGNGYMFEGGAGNKETEK